MAVEAPVTVNTSFGTRTQPHEMRGVMDMEYLLQALAAQCGKRISAGDPTSREILHTLFKKYKQNKNLTSRIKSGGRFFPRIHQSLFSEFVEAWIQARNERKRDRSYISPSLATALLRGINSDGTLKSNS